MKFSTKGRYAMCLMLDLAQQPSDRYVSLRDAACRQHISVKYAEQIINLLVRAGLVESTRGVQGGYRLTRPAENCTCGDVMRAAEGGFAPIPCLEEAPHGCERREECVVLPFWLGLQQAVERYADGISLQDVLQMKCSPGA